VGRGYFRSHHVRKRVSALHAPASEFLTLLAPSSWTAWPIPNVMKYERADGTVVPGGEVGVWPSPSTSAHSTALHGSGASSGFCKSGVMQIGWPCTGCSARGGHAFWLDEPPRL
jgi:hypothetical protein